MPNHTSALLKHLTNNEKAVHRRWSVCNGLSDKQIRRLRHCSSCKVSKSAHHSCDVHSRSSVPEIHVLATSIEQEQSERAHKR